MRSGRRIHLFVLIDALGWEFLKGREFLDDLLPYRQPLRTVLGFSSGAIPSILTGVPPSQHGHWNLFYYDPQGSPFRWLRHFTFLPDRVLDNRLSRKLLKEMGRRMLGLGPLFDCCVSPRLLPLFSWVEKRNIYDRGGISGAQSIFDQLSDRGVPYKVYTYHHWTDQEILGHALKDVQESEASFLFVYLSEMDMLLHDHWKHPQPAEQRLNVYADRLRELFDSAREIDPGATFIVTSDHGMTAVREHYELVKQVESLGFSMPKDYLAVYDSTMARFWFFSDGARREVTALLATLPCGRILPDDEVRRLGILFPDRRYGEMIFLLHPGWLITASDFKVRGWTPAGMHGYHPDDPYSDAVFLSNRRPEQELRTIADVYQVMREAAEVGSQQTAGALATEP
jgi:predicted AlkP superfamily pyrophosphatase or phosphodiesterase